MTFIEGFSALWPIFVAIVGVMITGISIYFRDKAKVLEDVNREKILIREQQVKSEKDIAILKQKIESLEMVTDHLTRAGEGIKDKLDTIEPRLAAIDVKLNFIIDYIKKEDR